MKAPVRKSPKNSRAVDQRRTGKTVSARNEMKRANPKQVRKSASNAPAKVDEKRPAGKLGQVLDAVIAGRGASLGELVELTGWQPHTARAALTRLRQRGFAVHLDTNDGRKAYHLAGASAR
jgi:hypothetical protein